ncbi:MAG: FG-GAP repeat domain-containing protein, partial [Bacteroidota bacterium]
MLYSRQLSILKNKLLHLDTNSIKEVSVCRSTYINIRKNISPVQIKRALGGAAFAVLLQILPIQSDAQNRAVFNFGSPQFNPFGLQSIQGASITLPALSDLDNDGDVDMIVAYSDTTAYQSIFKYYLNEGTINNPEFVDNGASIFADSIASADFIFSAPVFADLDNDGDQDILAGTSDYASSTYD